MANEFFIYLGIFLAVSLAFAYWLKKKFGVETYAYIISLIKTTKANPAFDKIARIGRPLDWLADFGIVMGFGALAVDFVWGRKLPAIKRIALFIASFLVLTGISYTVFGGFLRASPITEGQDVLFSIVFGLSGFAGFAVLALVSQGWHIIEKLLVGKKPLPGVAPVIPGVQLPNVPLLVPLHGWISFLIILVLHEGFHGVIARREGLRVKSAGLLLLGFLPIGAFVEPDDEELKQTTPRKKLRVFASGAMANVVFTFALLAVLIVVWGGIVSPMVSPTLTDIHDQSVIGVKIDGVSPTSEFEGDVYANSAFGVLEPGMKILQVNGAGVKTVAQFQQQLSQDAASVRLLVEKPDGGTIDRSFEKNPLGRIGISVSDIQNPDYIPPWYYQPSVELLGLLQSFFQWLLLLSFLVGFINFLPMNPFDGGKMATTIIPSYLGFLNRPAEEIEKNVGKAIFYFLLVVFIINAIPLFIP